MASFAAELHVAGHVFSVLGCHFEVHQGTQQRGRVSTKVRYGPVQLTLEVPNDDTLLAWAADPHKRQPAQVRFRNGAGGSVLETLALPAAYCVTYAEEFQEGDLDTGAYMCHLTLADPGGWTLTAGGPAGAFMAPAALDHGLPGVAAAAARAQVDERDLAARPFLKNDADPLRDVLGPGQLSHPQEWQETIALLKQEGVDVVMRDGVMAYGPQPMPGKPGRLIIDPNASIGALRHETQHFIDDKALNFPGMKALLTPKTRWQMEYKAYIQEVRLARDLRAFPAGRQLVRNAREEKLFIAKNYGPVN